MPTHSATSDDDSVEFDPQKAKVKRTQDAEKIRQDFIKSQRLPVDPSAGQEPSPESNGDAY